MAEIVRAAVVVILAGAVSTGCAPAAAPTSGPGGTVTVAFVIDNGLMVTSVSYILVSPTNPELQGTIQLPDENEPLSLQLEVPPATGDILGLTVHTSIGTICVGYSAPFVIVAGGLTAVQIALDTCSSLQKPPGTVDITVTVCPGFESLVAAPAETAVSSSLDVTAALIDPTAADFTFRWTPAQNFANPGAAQTTFTCTEPGVQTLTLTATEKCQRQPSGQIVCPNCQVKESVTAVCDVHPAPPSDNPNCQPILIEGSDTGFDSCGGGATRRRAAISCPGPIPTNHATCLRDSDCSAGQLCDCGQEICTPASCITGADCAPGLDCLATDQPDPAKGRCGVDVGYACGTPTDQCRGDVDCGPATSGNACLLIGGSRVCVTNFCPV